MKMKALKSLLVMTAVVGLVATMGARSFADILPPSLEGKTAGETEIRHPKFEQLIGYVDWIVLAPGNYGSTVYEQFVYSVVGETTLEEYLYLYQIEAVENGLVSFTITIGKAPFSEAGFFTDSLDLDEIDSAPVHDPKNSDFHWLSGENEATTQTLVLPYTVDSSTPTIIQWQWVYDPDKGYKKLNSGEESYVLYILSPNKPIYGYATLKNTGSGETYKVPVPSPEPSVIMLLMMGVGMVGIVRRRRKA